MSKALPPSEEKPIVRIMEEIKNGQKSFLDLDLSARMEIVSILRLAGHTVSQISPMMNCSDKTIRRVIALIKKEGRVEASTEFVTETVGELTRVAWQQWSMLMAIARNAAATTRDKIEAISAAWVIQRDYGELMRRIGYLPTGIQPVAHFNGNKEVEKTFDAMAAEVGQLKLIAEQTNILTPELVQELNMLDNKIKKADIGSSIKKIADQNNMIIENEVDDDSANEK